MNGSPALRGNRVPKRRIRELQNIAHHNLSLWKHTEEQKAQLSNSYHRLAVKSTLELKRQRDNFLQEIEDMSA